MSINDTIKERGSNYGSFESQGVLAQNLKDAVGLFPSWEKLEPYQKEAVEMILHKISRVVNGDPNYIDSWHDIAGYAILVENILRKNNAETGS